MLWELLRTKPKGDEFLLASNETSIKIHLLAIEFNRASRILWGEESHIHLRLILGTRDSL